MIVDALFGNGRIWTGDASHPEATTVAVHHGRIVAVDDTDGLQAARVHDLGGARIAPGHLADFVTLSDDILTIDPQGIKDVHVTATVIGGEMVMER